MLRFYGPVNPVGSCRGRSVYLTTLVLGRLSPLSVYSVLCTFFRQKLTTALLESAEGRGWPRKGENDRRKYVMINIHEWMLPSSAEVELATSWSPFGRASNWSTEAGHVTKIKMWSGPTLTTYRIIGQLRIWWRTDKDPNQTTWIHQLIRALAVRLYL